MNLNLTPFKEFSATNDWGMIWPEIALGVLALTLLIVELFAPNLRRRWLPRLAILGQIGILGALLIGFDSFQTPGTTLFSGMIEQSGLTQVMRIYFLLGSILVSYVGLVYLNKQSLPRMELFHVVIVVSASMMLLIQSAHFVMLFVALETVTIGFYVLVGYNRNSAFSLEGGLKYLILGGASSSILLFGIVMLYGAAGTPGLPGASVDSMQFSQLAAFIQANPDNMLVQVGVTLVLCGIFFKIGAVPFQIWIPDVYQGAPTPVTSFLAVSSKTAGFIVLIQLIRGPFAALENLTFPLLSAVAIMSILFGNIAALSQRNVKRVMGLSGISHAGYLLLGVIALVKGVTWAPWAVVFYLFTYMIGAFAVFAVMAHVAGEDDEAQELDHYYDLFRSQPFLSAILSIGLGSLAGIPPLAGFMGKLFLFIAAFQAGLIPHLIVAIIGVVISIYYYFGWMREIYFRNWQFPAEAEANTSAVSKRLAGLHLGLTHRITLAALAVLAILLGVYQGFLGLWPLSF